MLLQILDFQKIPNEWDPEETHTTREGGILTALTGTGVLQTPNKVSDTSVR
jgi:hypothetical protein